MSTAMDQERRMRQEVGVLLRSRELERAAFPHGARGELMRTTTPEERDAVLRKLMSIRQEAAQ